MEDILIILTSTVHVHNKCFLVQKDPQQRINCYLKSIKQWLEKTKFKIVLVENSGYLFEELRDYVKIYPDRFEIITFNEVEIKEAEYLKDNIHKGPSELFAINYAYTNKNNTNCKFVIKITARYFIPGFEKYLSNIFNYDGLSQNNIDRCEIVGASVKYFHNIFNTSLSMYDNVECKHIEQLYKYRVQSLDKILILPVLNIEPTNCGGSNQLINCL